MVAGSGLPAELRVIEALICIPYAVSRDDTGYRLFHAATRDVTLGFVAPLLLHGSMDAVTVHLAGFWLLVAGC